MRCFRASGTSPRGLTEAMEGCLVISIAHAASMPTASVGALVRAVGAAETSVAFARAVYTQTVCYAICAHPTSVWALFRVARVFIFAIDPQGSYFTFAVFLLQTSGGVDSFGTSSTLFVALL